MFTLKTKQSNVNKPGTY